jgi:hypothetical protein
VLDEDAYLLYLDVDYLYIESQSFSGNNGKVDVVCLQL